MKRITKKYKSFRKLEFEKFFKSKALSNEGDTYYGEGWIVIIGDEKDDYIGPMKFISVTLEIQVEEEIQDDFINQLRVNFLRGGG